MEEKNRINLLKHFFWGNFDSGVIFIFISFLIWEETENMFAVAIAFMIPVLINTVIDYYFSDLSDRYGRLRFIIVGNIGSAVFLSMYGLASGVYMLYLFIFLKSLFAKLCNTSLSPFIRESIAEDDYKDFLAKLNIRGNVGASIGGFALMTLYGFSENIGLIFLVSGLVELLSTVYLVMLKDVKHQFKKQEEEEVDVRWLREISIIYAVEAFGIALIVNRIVIFLHEYHSIELQYIGIVFFIAYGLSDIVAANIYRWFEKIQIKSMLILSFILQAIVLVLIATVNQLYFIIFALFVYELIDNVTEIYTSDKVNKSLYTNIGKRLSSVRVTIAIGTILGQLVVGQIWDKVGFIETFYFSSAVLVVLALAIRSQKSLVIADDSSL